MGENTINGRPVEAREVSALVELIREVDPKLAEEIKGSVSPDHIKRLDINANGVLDIADVLETNTDRKTLDAEIGRFQKLACYLAKYGVKASMACSQQGLPQLLEVYDLPSLYATMSRLYREDPQVKIVVGVGADWCAPCKKYEGTFKNVVTDNDNPHIRMIHFFSVHGSSLGEFDRGGIPLFVQVDPKKYEAIELSHNLLDPLVGLKLKTRTRENEIAFLSKQAGQAWSVIWQPARERLLDLGAMTEKDLGPLFKSDETEDVAWVLAQVEKRFPQKKLEYVRDLLQRNNPALPRPMIFWLYFLMSLS
ncbi:MAG: hypothetical protein HY073_03145 [Deltaproteobacteria bacterium]|nr:hypothetical protein [Deltaproteobacteria bacterium]